MVGMLLIVEDGKDETQLETWSCGRYILFSDMDVIRCQSSLLHTLVITPLGSDTNLFGNP